MVGSIYKLEQFEVTASFVRVHQRHQLLVGPCHQMGFGIVQLLGSHADVTSGRYRILLDGHRGALRRQSNLTP